MVLRAQSSYVLAGDHKITIEGSSNVHDWEEVAQTASGDAAVLWNPDATFAIQKFNLKVTASFLVVSNTLIPALS